MSLWTWKTFAPDDVEDVEHTGSIIWNYYKFDGAQSKNGGAKNFICTFCDTSFTISSSTRAFAHILGRSVLGQNVKACVPIHKCVKARVLIDKDDYKFIIDMHNSKMRRKFSTKICWPKKNC